MGRTPKRGRPACGSTYARWRLRRSNRGGVAIVPGKSAQSELVGRIESTDADTVMPPPDSNKSLSERDKQILRQWIDEGAEYHPHWAFVPPREQPLPAVKQADWPRNGIDRFVLARLEGEGLAPSPEADRHVQLRRVTLDLTGLPPTPAELDAFLSDPASDAYEKWSTGCWPRRTMANGWR